MQKIKSYFKLYEEFINEIEFSHHWKNERASLLDFKSRIRHVSERYPEGWKCDKFFYADENGDMQEGYENVTKPFKQFLEDSKIEESEFNKLVQNALYKITHEGKIKTVNYDESTEFFKFIFVGKLVFHTIEKENYFEIEGDEEVSKTRDVDRYYSPIFTNKSKGKTFSGNEIWAFVKSYNIGTTMIYMLGHAHDTMKKVAYNDYLNDYEKLLADGKEHPLRKEQLTFEEFLDNYKTVYDIGQVVTIDI